MKAWIRANWTWLALLVAVLLLGIWSGWKLAVALGIGLVSGGAATRLDDNHKERAAQGAELERQRQDLDKRKEQTDQMIDDYFRGKGGGHQ